MAVRRAELGVLVRPVNINKPTAGINDPTLGIGALIAPGLETAEPEDAGSDEIIFRRSPVIGELAGGLSRLENHAGRRTGADALADLVQALGRPQGILDAADAGPGRAYGVSIALRTSEMP